MSGGLSDFSSRLWGLKTYNTLKRGQPNVCIFFKIAEFADQYVSQRLILSV